MKKQTQEGRCWLFAGYRDPAQSWHWCWYRDETVSLCNEVTCWQVLDDMNRSKSVTPTGRKRSHCSRFYLTVWSADVELEAFEQREHGRIARPIFSQESGVDSAHFKWADRSDSQAFRTHLTAWIWMCLPTAGSRQSELSDTITNCTLYAEILLWWWCFEANAGRSLCF